MKLNFWARLKESLRPNGPFDPTHRFSTSWLVSPYILFTIRTIFSLYSFLVLFCHFGFKGYAKRSDWALETITFLPYLNYWGLAIYFAVSAFHTFSYARWGKPFLARWPRTLQQLHSLLYSTIVVFPLLITLFGALMYRYDLDFEGSSLYILNTIFATTEMLISRTDPIPVWHFFPLLLISILYLALEYLTYENHKDVEYLFFSSTHFDSWVDTSQYLIFCLTQCVMFFILHYLIKGRDYLTESTTRTTIETNDVDLETFRAYRLSDESLQKQNMMRSTTVRVVAP